MNELNLSHYLPTVNTRYALSLYKAGRRADALLKRSEHVTALQLNVSHARQVLSLLCSPLSKGNQDTQASKNLMQLLGDILVKCKTISDNLGGIYHE